MFPNKSKRRIVRERVLQVLYAYEMNKESLDNLSGEILSEIIDKSDKNFALELIRNVLANLNDLDNKITENENAMYTTNAISVILAVFVIILVFYIFMVKKRDKGKDVGKLDKK